MATYNIHGLSRSIPEDIKRKIRQDSGFGCVICGCGIFEYEHIDPEFCDAKEHDPEKMTLLCPTCHGKVTRGIVSKQTVIRAKKNPMSLQNGFSNDWFDFSPDKTPILTFGNTTFEECQIPIQIDNIPIIQFKPPLIPNTPFLLSGIICDKRGEKIIEIIDNEWRAFNNNWDMIFVGKLLTVRDATGDVVLSLKVDPPNGIIIEKLKMFVMGQRILITAKKLVINGASLVGMAIDGFRVAISIS